MSTNGESARQWLADHGAESSREQLQRIRNALSTRLDKLSEDHPDQEGLLEAMDVMDEWLDGMEDDKTPPAPLTPAPSEPSTAQAALDTSPLTPDIAAAPALSSDEKNLRFQQLLKTGKISSEF